MKKHTVVESLLIGLANLLSLIVRGISGAIDQMMRR